MDEVGGSQFSFVQLDRLSFESHSSDHPSIKQ